MKLIRTIGPLCAAIFSLTHAAIADVKPASLFTDHMVLQQGQAVPVWGWAEPGEQVTVMFGDQSQTATAGADKKWMVKLDALKVSADPARLVIAGNNTITFNDILVGDVWLASGQSNMDFTVAKTPRYNWAGVDDEAAEVSAANYPTIRFFKGATQKTYVPQTTVGGAWMPCTPENVKEFSAIGYLFARDIQKEINVPIGVIQMTFGASCVQAWIRRDALGDTDENKVMMAAFDQKYDDFKSKGEGKDPSGDQHNPTVMYNGMIAPMVPFAIKGVIWYQGESITTPLDHFSRLNDLLIKDWRSLWGAEFPFYFVQVSAHAKTKALVREFQQRSLALPKTGMAVSVDIGNKTNVHPKNKQDVADRLARIALANTYGKSIEFSGPMYEGMKVDGNKAILTFKHGVGLTIKGDKLDEFVIAGVDQKFVPAAATIEGDTIVVASPEISEPTAVRYAFANYPEHPNLYNAAGLPAAPFRTDAWTIAAPTTAPTTAPTSAPATQPSASRAG